MRRPRITAAALPEIARWLGQFGMFSIVWLIAFAVAPMALGWQPRSIISGSMEPRIHVGDVVVIDPGVPTNLRPGQVMSFIDPNNPKRVLTHRLVKKNDDGTWQTKGDANPTPDSAPIHAKDIVGKPKILVPWVGMLSYWIYEGHPEYAVAGAAVVVILAWLGMTGLNTPTGPPDTATRPRTPRHRRSLRQRINNLLRR